MDRSCRGSRNFDTWNDAVCLDSVSTEMEMGESFEKEFLFPFFLFSVLVLTNRGEEGGSAGRIIRF